MARAILAFRCNGALIFFKKDILQRESVPRLLVIPKINVSVSSITLDFIDWKRIFYLLNLLHYMTTSSVLELSVRSPKIKLSEEDSFVICSNIYLFSNDFIFLFQKATQLKCTMYHVHNWILVSNTHIVDILSKL